MAEVLCWLVFEGVEDFVVHSSFYSCGAVLSCQLAAEGALQHTLNGGAAGSCIADHERATDFQNVSGGAAQSPPLAGTAALMA